MNNKSAKSPETGLFSAFQEEKQQIKNSGLADPESIKGGSMKKYL